MLNNFVSKIENDSVSDFLINMFDIKNSNKGTKHLEPFYYRKLFGNEEELFTNWFKIYDESVLISERLQLDNDIYQSVEYKRTSKNKKSSYISFFDDENLCFGQILYFIGIKEYSFVMLKPFKIKKNSILSNFPGRISQAIIKLKKKGIFENIFFQVEKSDDLKIIDSVNIKN